MHDDRRNMEQLAFTNGVRVTRARHECAVHGWACNATAYTLFNATGQIISLVIQCQHMGVNPEEQVPVHEAASGLLNRDPDTKGSYNGHVLLAGRAAERAAHSNTRDVHNTFSGHTGPGSVVFQLGDTPGIHLHQ